MIQLRVLGPLHLSATDGRDVASLERQPKRSALLAYLALARPRGAQPRDRLLALFWPESDTSHASAALSQATYVLRSVLGEDAIEARAGGRQLSLAPGAIWCDAAAFEDALDDGRPAEAMALYEGELLDGFFISGAAEFERWLEGERARLKQRAVEGAWAIAEQTAAQGDVILATRWARRAAGLAPTDEAVIRRLMGFLSGLGDRAGAMAAYEAFAWRLADEYELKPSAATRAFADALRDENATAQTAEAALPPVSAPERPAPFLTPVVGTAASKRRGWPALLPRPLLLGLTVAVVLATVGVAFMAPSEVPVPAVTRFALDFTGVPPVGKGVAGTTVALTPDGTSLVYVGAGEEGNQLYFRLMDRLAVIPISHTSGARLPFFSPDGEWLGFVQGSRLQKVPRAGGNPVTLWETQEPIFGASWDVPDAIVCATPSGLWLVRPRGGGVRLIALADTARGEYFRWPMMLPGGNAVIFTRGDSAGLRLAAISPKGGAVTELGLAGATPRFVPPNHLVYVRAGGTLLAVRFDPATVRATGEPVLLGDGVSMGLGGSARFAASTTGVLAWVQNQNAPGLVLVDRGGEMLSEPPDLTGAGHPRFAPDGSRLALSLTPSSALQLDLWVVDIEGSSRRRITWDGISFAPVWSPAGRIAYTYWGGSGSTGYALRWISAEGGPSELLRPRAQLQFANAFTPDGRELVFQKHGPDGNSGLWVLPLEGERVPRPYSSGPHNERGATFSPDGKWLAFTSDASGREEIYVADFPHRRRQVQVSLAGGSEARWTAAGELFYRTAEGVIAASFASSDPPAVQARTLLFNERQYDRARYEGAAFDVHPGGSRFAMVQRAAHGDAVIVVLNQLDALVVREGRGRLRTSRFRRRGSSG